MPSKTNKWPLWAILDLILIVLFALLGRREHEHGLDLGGILWTALPFMIGYAISLSLSRPWQSINSIWPTGLLVWLGTVILGLATRILLGSTAAVSFMVVTLVVLGAFLMGRRVLTRLATKRSAKGHA